MTNTGMTTMLLMRVLNGIVAAGVVMAGLVLWRTAAIRRARWIVAGLTAYGAAAFLHAMLTGIALAATLAGNGLFQRLPYVLQGAFVGAFLVLPLGWIASLAGAGIPRFRKGSLRRNLYQAVALTTCIALLFTSLPQRTGSSPFHARAKSPAERAAEFDKSLRAIDDGERKIVRDTWDPDYVVSKVGRDPQRLFKWVHQNTYWIPYRGVLRGPVGVLMDTQGNSLDRALLLATLLEKAGHAVRLARGELTREQAIALLPSLASRRAVNFRADETSEQATEPDTRWAVARYALDGRAIEQAVRAQEQVLERVSSQLKVRVADQTKRLLQDTGTESQKEEWRHRYETYIDALRDHWWVQRQDGQRWVDLDLLPPEGSTAALQVAKDTLPVADVIAEQYHQIAIRVVAEHSSAGTISERKTLEYVLRPADVIGKAVVLQFLPTDWLNPTHSASSASSLLSAVIAQHEWIVGLAVGSADVASAILRDGDDSTGRSGGSSTGGGGGPFGGLGAALDETLNNKRENGSGSAISAVWIEYEIRVPGEKPRIIRRAVFDLLGPTARASHSPQLRLDDGKKLTRGLALTMKTEILPVVCQLAPEFVSHLAADSLLANAGLLHEIAANEFFPNADKARQEIGKAKAPVSPLVTLAFNRLQSNRSSGLIFLDRPNLLTRHQSLFSNDKGIALRNAFDIVANEVAVDLTVRDGFAIRLEQGVRDTNLEALMTTGSTIGNTAEAYAESRDWLRIAPVQAGALYGVSFPDDIRRLMASDLADGYVLVTPRAPVHRRTETFVGWWRIDPVTGNTLGIADDGWGQAVTEESFHLRVAIEFSRGFVFEYTLCQSFPLAMNSIRIINEEVFGGWHPSWTPPASKSQDPIEMADQNMNMCIVQAIAMGFAATLPILLMTWKVSSTGRSMAFIKRVLAEEEEFEELARTRPCLSSALAPTTLPVAFLFVPPVAMLLFQAPCHPVDPSRLPTQPRRVPGPNDTLVDPPTIQPPKPGIKSTKELANELRKAWVELEEANREMLKDTQELAQYSGQANKDDKTWEALIARADQTYADRFSPAVDRYRTLKKLFGDLYPGGPVLQRRVAGGAGASDALGGGPPSSGSPL